MTIEVTLDSLIEGNTDILRGHLKKMRTKLAELERVKSSLTKHEYQLLVQIQDECIGLFDVCGTLNTLLLLRDYNFAPVAQPADAALSKGV